MRAGEIVYDGAAAGLTAPVLEQIYGAAPATTAEPGP
jgi:ABC-type phosphate/phosphonate transport system ATPase subunit